MLTVCGERNWRQGVAEETAHDTIFDLSAEPREHYYSFKNYHPFMKYIWDTHQRFLVTVLEADPPGIPNPPHKHQPAPTLHPTCRSPVAFFGILQSQLLELLIHLLVEVISEEEGPEAEESVHLLRLADAQAFPL